MQNGGKGMSVQAVVEMVTNGSTLRVTLLPDLTSATVMVAGVQCPSMGRRPPSSALNGGDASGAAPAEATKEAQPEPFAREARHYTESRCLNRDVRLVIEGVSQFGVLVATVLYPGSLGASEAAEDLGSSLVKAGLAKTVEWSLNMMTSGAFKLREMERAARQARLGLWHSYVLQPGASAKLSDNFTGTVTEIVSGDCLLVRDSASNTERRVNLSSIRAPRGATRERPAEPWAAEAKEFLRQRLIGKEVSVRMEYTRKVPQAGGEDRVMSFGTVVVAEQSTHETPKSVNNNVAELLLVRGLAQVTKHRGDEERSGHFEDLINAEEAGKKGKKGVWGSKEPLVPRVNDITAPGSAARARQHLPFLQRAGRLRGVVEYVLSGSRLKIYVPKEGVTIAFSPSGIRCPGRDEPLSTEAMAFTRGHCMQREVEIEVESVDKAGTFLGSLRVPPVEGHGKGLILGVALLESGLARLHESLRSVPELAAAQEKAQKLRVGIWEKEDPASASAAAAQTEGTETTTEGATATDRSVQEILVTDVTDGNAFFVQLVGEARASWVADQLAGMDLDDSPTPTNPLKAGDTCIARFSADGQWYRAVVEKVYASDPVAPQYDVYFVDYGNRDRVTKAGMRPVPADLAAVPPQAHPARLAWVRAPGLEADYGIEAAQRLSELVGGGKPLRAVVERREPGAVGGVQSTKGWSGVTSGSLKTLVLSVLMDSKPGGANGAVHSDNEGEGSKAQAIDWSRTVSCVLAQEGLVRVEKPGKGRSAGLQGDASALAAVQAAEERARRAHAGMWRYGDPGDEEDEDDGGFPSLGAPPASKGSKAAAGRR